MLGYIRLRMENPVFIQAVRVYPRGDTADVCVTIDAAHAFCGNMRITSPALAENAEVSVDIPAGQTEIWRKALPLRSGVPRWDIEEGLLHPLTVSAPGIQSVTVHFGVRDFQAEGGSLRLNGRNIFLRGEANCARSIYRRREPRLFRLLTLSNVRTHIS